MIGFATPSDVAARWRPLSADEVSVAQVLIQDATDIIKVHFPTVSADVAAGILSADTLVRVTANMVRRAMMNRDFEGVIQGTETVGPFNRSQTFANPNGNLYLTADDIRSLQPDGFAPRVRIGWLA